VGAELGQPALVGKMQPLGWAVIPRIFLVRVNYRRLVFSDDHLVPPYACAERPDELNFAPLEASVQEERVPRNFRITEFQEDQLRVRERCRVRRVISSSCSQPSPTKL
jgi:hypothetical protein